VVAEEADERGDRCWGDSRVCEVHRRG
jgi:hypothetical protein